MPGYIYRRGHARVNIGGGMPGYIIDGGMPGYI